MKKFLGIILILTLLSSCEKSEEILTKEKQDFFIEIQEISNLSGKSSIIKSGKLEGKEDIIISSQANGRVGNIFIKEGDTVNKGQKLINLEDTVANYYIALERANNAVDQLQINYDSTKLNLEKQIFDAEINLKNLNNSLQTLKNTSEINISQAEDNLNNADYSGTGSKSSLELQKLDESISKSKLDFENALKANRETISSYKNLIVKEASNQTALINDIYNFGDKFYNFTGLNQDNYDKIKMFFGAIDSTKKEQTRSQLEALYRKKSKLNFTANDITEENIDTYIAILNGIYDDINVLLNNFEDTIRNSIPSVGSLSEAEMDAYIAALKGYQTQYITYNSTFVSLQNTITSFLNTYLDSEKSLEKNLELLENERELFLKNYDIGQEQYKNVLDQTIISSNDSIQTLELQIEQAEKTVETLKKSKDLSLAGIETNIKEAKISRELAQKEIAKLSILASIGGVIKTIFVDEGQDVTIGSQLVAITSDSSSSVDLSFKKSELQYLSVGDKVFAQIGDEIYTGSIYSISTISDDSLNYKAKAVFNDKIQNLGGVIDVTIPVEVSSVLIPLNSVKFVGTNLGIINIYKDGKIIEKEVSLGKIFTDNVEFIGFNDETSFDEEIYLIISDISSFDEDKFNIKIMQ